MNANEWLGVMKQAQDFPEGMEKLIIKYGEMLIEEHDNKNKTISTNNIDKHDDNHMSKITETLEVYKPSLVYVKYINWAGKATSQAVTANDIDDAKKWMEENGFKVIGAKQIYFTIES